MNPCKNCPFLKDKAWYGLNGSAPNAQSKIDALKEATRQGIFSCHVRNPDRNIFTVKDMEVNDCIGFQQMKENMTEPNKYPNVVNYFNETGPDYDLNYWAEREGFKSELLQL